MQAVLLLFLALSASALPQLPSSPAAASRIDDQANSTSSTYGVNKRDSIAYVENFDNAQCSGSAIGPHMSFSGVHQCMHFNPTLKAFRIFWGFSASDADTVSLYAGANCEGTPVDERAYLGAEYDCIAIKDEKQGVGSLTWYHQAPLPPPKPTSGTAPHIGDGPDGVAKRDLQPAYLENFDNEQCSGNAVGPPLTFALNPANKNQSCMPFKPTHKAFRISWGGPNPVLDANFLSLFTGANCQEGDYFNNTIFMGRPECIVVKDKVQAVQSVEWRYVFWG